MLDKKFYNEVYTELEKEFGEESQYIVCIEEMSELTKALCKYMRYKDEVQTQEDLERIKKIKENVIEECADVLICAGHMRKMFGADEVDKIMDYKIQRGKKVAENHKNIKTD